MAFEGMDTLEKYPARENGLQTFFPLFTQGTMTTGIWLLKEQDQLNSANFCCELK